MTEVELSYIAGFFDGEGSVSINTNGKPSPRGIVPNHTLQVSIGNTNDRVLIWIRDNFGGIITYRKPKFKNHRYVAQWILRCGKAKDFLIAIRPFLKMKVEQVDVAINYQNSKAMNGPKSIPDEIVSWREEQRNKIKFLNAKSFITAVIN